MFWKVMYPNENYFNLHMKLLLENFIFCTDMFSYFDCIDHNLYRQLALENYINLVYLWLCCSYKNTSDAHVIV